MRRSMTRAKCSDRTAIGKHYAASVSLRDISGRPIKGESLLTPGETLDWRAIMTTLLSEGYQGRFGLETHFGKGLERVRNAHASMEEIGKLLDN
jgi:hypothetical protein